MGLGLVGLCACVGDIGSYADESVADAAADPDVAVNQAPVAAFAASPAAGPAPLAVTFDASASSDVDGTIVTYAWDFGDGGSAEGGLVEHGFATAGCYLVELTVTDDDGATDATDLVIVATDGRPSADSPLVAFAELPTSMQVVPRDVATNEGTIAMSGTVGSRGYDAVVVKVLREGALAQTARAALCSLAQPDPFALELRIPAELASYAFEIYLAAGSSETLVEEVDDVVAGDVIIIQGQSNAVANQYSGVANGNQGAFLRSFGTESEDPAASAADSDWHLADGDNAYAAGSVGQWGLRMGRLLIDANEVPVAILNGARGGMPIAYFQRNDVDPTDSSTNYGRLLSRARRSGVDAGVRAILFYQGESDGANATGHRDGFVALYQDWLEDYPSVERSYVTQVRAGCGDPSLALRDAQRLLADDFTNISVMSTTGLDGHDGCHFAYENGYRNLGERYAALLLRDLYGGADVADIESPNPARAFFSAADGSEITLVMRNDADALVWDDGAEQHFLLAASSASILSGQVVGSTVVLTLSGDGRDSSGLSYVGHSGAGPWVTNANQIGLLAFDALPIDPV